MEVVVDKYTMDTRHLVYELPSVYDTIISFPVSVMDGTAMLQIRNNTVFYSLHLAGLYSPLTAYTAVVTPLRCSHKIQPGKCIAFAPCNAVVYLLRCRYKIRPDRCVTVTAHSAVVSPMRCSYKIRPGRCMLLLPTILLSTC